MAQTLNQNGHTVWSIWTSRSSYPFEKPWFLVMYEKYYNFGFSINMQNLMLIYSLIKNNNLMVTF
jgi:hypothetical protein